MAGNGIKYQFAIDEGNNLVSINSITKENRKQHTYRCIGCGNELLPRAIGSTHRSPHFYHKETVNCSGETYLHKLAKLAIQDRFYSSEKFVITYPITWSCNNTSCQIRNRHCKTYQEGYSINLKDYYDTCNEEVEINGFIADLLLTNSQNPEQEPILIEICVTHSCEPEKRQSGLKIMEIKVKNEEDIANIYLADNIKEYSPYTLDKPNNVEFIGFKKVFQKPMTTEITRYVFDPTIHVNGYMTRISCIQANYKISKESMIEANILSPYDGIHHIIPLQWLAVDYNVRRCDLCKFYYATYYESAPICRLSKHGKPAHPAKDEAERCRSYYANVSFFKDALAEYTFQIVTGDVYKKDMDEYRVIIAGSSSFFNYDLMKEKCCYYLENKIKTHHVILLSGTSVGTMELIKRLSADLKIIVESNFAEWDRFGRSAVDMANIKMIERANALIAFWDGKSTKTKQLIDMAKTKQIPVKIIRY